jgi:hypothetical protein
MSDNCVTALKDAIKAGNSYLEWGAGNSTILATKIGKSKQGQFRIVSVEHDQWFFGYLVDAVMAELEDPSVRKTSFHLKTKKRSKLASSTAIWQILWNNKRVQWVEGNVPKFGIPWSLPRQLLKIIIAYVLSILRKPAALCVDIQDKDLSITMWCVPPASRVLLEGPLFQLYNYVEVPLSERFDTVLIDGRCRASCVHRVFEDGLLNDGGTLFTHDAFRAEMMEKFKLLSPTAQFIHGSNRMENGSKRIVEGFPLISVDGVEQIVQELYVYKK